MSAFRNLGAYNTCSGFAKISLVESVTTLSLDVFPRILVAFLELRILINFL